MYNNVLRSSIAVANKFCSNVVAYPVQYKSLNSKFKIFHLTYYVKHCVAITRCYCDERNLSRSHQTTLEYNKKYEEKLQELLKEPSNEHFYKKFLLELEVLKHESGRVPETLKAKDWLMLLAAPSRSQRRSYIEYLWKIERKNENRQAKKLRLQEEIEQKPQTSPEESDHIFYGLQNNSMFMRIYDTTIAHYYNHKLITAMLFAPKIVFDLEYENIMSAYETQNCAKQLKLSFAANRIHNDPFNVYFCNANPSGLLMQSIHQGIPTVYDPEFPLNITSKSYLELFDKSKLVYLSPNSTEVLEKFDHDMIYIIGAFVDKMKPQPVSFAKAKKEGIKTVRLPLAEYLPWGSGSAKNLPLNHVLSILLDLKEDNNWERALKHIPSRKLQSARIKSLEHNITKRNKMIELLTHGK
ncbi:mitochondrial ribonuclease P protein 1 homolog [Hylaeus volcanicus]|uniref:mitochondrial ribonuclease P protein 1 homolog n=1 Tax=Hylaeus volcanicus TaxID=313075 RepID=UPI0023B7C3CC|nr:mitochondrial ribonuclease P protein 1 homolog [Hylaeus volcanicus]